MILAEDLNRQTETLAMVGFLAGCGGATRTSYATGLRRGYVGGSAGLTVGQRVPTPHSRLGRARGRADQ